MVPNPIWSAPGSLLRVINLKFGKKFDDENSILSCTEDHFLSLVNSASTDYWPTVGSLLNGRLGNASVGK